MESAKLTVDKAKIQMAIRSGVSLTITTYTLPRDMEVYMGDVLLKFLDELGQQHMEQYLSYCLNELITNAKKANTKRVYFKEQGLDITNERDYNKGMKSFKEDTLGNIDHYLQKQKEEGLYVKLILQMRNGKIKVEVRNNSALTIFEYKRIHDKLARAQRYSSVQEALEQILDESEGAGLGLVIMILMLKKIGLTEENFQTISENGETITRIILPLSENTMQAISVVSDEFIKTINDLPQFPQNIVRLNKLLNDPDSRMSDIAQQISSDVTITGELLKLVNSAAFSLTQPCDNIADAVKLVGIRGIKNMLISIGTIETFSNVRGNKEELWAHAYKAAFYSYNLARNFCAKEKSVVDDAYLCGLLHDMGKIIFETAHPDLIKHVLSSCEEKGVSADVFEKLIAGVNHAEIGAKVAEKWNFPEVIADVIRFHHNPENAPKEIMKLTSIVSLADLMIHYEEKTIDFYQVDEILLNMFDIKSEQQFQTISDRLSQAFSAEK